MYNHYHFIEELAKQHVEILHTAAKPRFFRSNGLASLDGLLANISSVRLPAFVAEDGKDSRLADNLSDNIIEHSVYTVYVLFPAKADEASVTAARVKAKAVAEDIVSVLRLNQVNGTNGLDLFDFNTVRMQGIGPLGDNAHGVMLSYVVPAGAAVVFDPTRWTNVNS